MDFAFSDEQDEFRAVVRRFIEERWSIDRCAQARRDAGRLRSRRLEADGGGARAARARDCPKRVGGQGFGFLEARHRARRDGATARRRTVPRERRRRRARDRGRRERRRSARSCCRDLASGATIATLAVLEASGRHGRRRHRDDCASRRRDGFRVTGRKVAVLDAQNADLLLVAAREAGSAGEAGISLFAVRSDAAGRRREADRRPRPHAQARRRRARRRARDAARRRRRGVAGARAHARPRGDRASRPSAVGAAARCLESAVDYAKSRIQFARPIGVVPGDQAQGRRGDARARVGALGRVLVVVGRGAARRLRGATSPRPRASRSPPATTRFLRAAAENVHIHGGVGFTWEFDCHLYYRRAKTAEFLFGDPIWHRARLADQLGF